MRSAEKGRDGPRGHIKIKRLAAGTGGALCMKMPSYPRGLRIR